MPRPLCPPQGSAPGLGPHHTPGTQQLRPRQLPHEARGDAMHLRATAGRVPSPARTFQPHATCWAPLGVSDDSSGVALACPSWRSWLHPGAATTQHHVCPCRRWPSHPSCANKEQQHTSRRGQAAVLPAAPERHCPQSGVGTPGTHREPVCGSSPSRNQPASGREGTLSHSSTMLASRGTDGLERISQNHTS